MFYSGTFLRTIAQESSLLVLRNYSKTKGRTKNFCWKENMELELQKISANHEKQTSQVNYFSDFLCMGRCKSLGPLKLLLWYTHLFFFFFPPSWIPHSIPSWRWLQWLIAWWLDGEQYSFFTEMAGNHFLSTVCKGLIDYQ